MLERIQPTLTLLDQGIALYRRHFLAFALISAGWFVPLAIAVAVLIAVGNELDAGFVVLLAVFGTLAAAFLMLYLIVALSRTAGAALDGRAMRVRELLRFEPLRLLGMAVFAIVYVIVAQLLSSVISILCICPLYLVGIFFVGGVAVAGGSAGATAGGLAFVAIFGLVYLISIFIGGAIYGGLVYGLQPWAQDGVGFGISLQRSIDLLVYRFWRNLVAWGLAALLVTAIGVTVTIAIGVMLPLPVGLTIGFDHPAAQAVTAGAWLFGLIFVLPPLPIWMALLYRTNRIDREGMVLQARITTWQQQNLRARS